MRDQFIAELSKLPRPRSGDEGGVLKTSKWQYFKAVYFLKDVVKARPSSGNLTISEEVRSEVNPQIDKSRQTWPGTDDEDNVFGYDTFNSPTQQDENVASSNNVDMSEIPGPSKNSVTSLEQVSPTDQPTQHKVNRIKRKRVDDYTTSMLAIEQKKLDLLAQKIARKEDKDAEDEHLLFFKALLPHVHKIRPENVLQFRGRIQEVVQEFAYPINYSVVEPLVPIQTTTPNSSTSSSATGQSVFLDNGQETTSAVLTFISS